MIVSREIVREQTFADRVFALRDRVLRNDPDHRDPDRYHVEKSQIARDLEELAMDTTHMTLEEHGAYLLLLMAMWRREGAIPDDDTMTGRMLGLKPRQNVGSALSEEQVRALYTK